MRQRFGGLVVEGIDRMPVPGTNPPATPGKPTISVASAPASELALDPDIGLLSRIANRDEAALGDFYERNVSTVFGLALRITRVRAVAEEVVADSFLQVWQQAGRYDATRGRPLAWLLNITRSRAIDASAQGEVGAPGRWQGDPLESLDQYRQDQALHQAMSELSPVQRQVITLAYFRGLSQSEIADHVTIPLGTVKSHVRFALQTLRRVLGPQFSAAED